MFLVPNIDQMYKEMKKIVEVGNGDEFPDFADLFFFWHNEYKHTTCTEIDVKLKLQTCSACQDLHTLQF